MGLTFSRMMIRYRARAIKGVKANCKRSWKNDLNCRFCNNTVIEDQEHLEECTGLSWERRRLKMDTEVGKIIFFRRAKRKLEGRLWCSTPWDGASCCNLWFVNMVPLLLNLVYHNCIMFDLADITIQYNTIACQLILCCLGESSTKWFLS